MLVSNIIKLMDDKNCRNNIIFKSLIKADNVINNPAYKNIICSISGGSDSDIVLDICHKVDVYKKITYVWFDTGLEYQATKDHLKFLEEKYNIKICREKAKVPIPISNKLYGQPFLSKQVSEWISRLQKHNFKWEDESYDALIRKYPKCKAALKWWTNNWQKNKNGMEASYNIAYNKYLKEFILETPPTHLISNKCCQGAKKDVIKEVLKEYNADLNIYGIRKAEGGARSTQIKTCYNILLDIPEYRPIFWYKDEDKTEYEKTFGILHSKCYYEYGLTRTGCAGCPFGRDFEQELEIIREFEPKLYRAVNNIFKDSYEYTRKYLQFKKEMKIND